MLDIKNQTPFPSALIPTQDKTGLDAAIVVVKGTFRIGAGEPTLAEDQRPVARVDSYFGEPGASSVRYEADTAPTKSGTDVVVIGHAYAPNRANTVDVELRAGPLRKLIRVSGDRHFGRATGGWFISEAVAFERIPLVYERAFGGEDKTALDSAHHEWEQHNPVGMGFVAKHTQKDLEGSSLPNLESPGAMMRAPTDRPAVVGVGFVARHWQPRRSYGGTMDDNWQNERAPLLPADFDERFHQGAPADQVTPKPMRGGERIAISSVLPGGGTLETTVPSHQLGVSCKLKGQALDCPPVLDTVVIDADERLMFVVWRAVIPCGRDLLYVDDIRIKDHA